MSLYKSYVASYDTPSTLAGHNGVCQRQNNASYRVFGHESELKRLFSKTGNPNL